MDKNSEKNFATALKTCALAYSYRDVKAVNNVSLCLKKGEISGLLGENGAGKSTLLSVLAGVKRASRGSYEIFGKNFYENESRSRSYISYLPDTAPIYPEMDLMAYINFVCELRGLGKSEAAARSEKYISLLGLSGDRRARLGSFSKGNRQRAALAAALVPEADVLLLDEPFSGLDPIQKRKACDVLKDFSAGRAVLFSSHQLSDIELLCDKVFFMRDGEVSGEDGDGGLAEKLLLVSPADPGRLLSIIKKDPSVIGAKILRTKPESIIFIEAVREKKLRSRLSFNLSASGYAISELKEVKSAPEQYFFGDAS